MRRDIEPVTIEKIRRTRKERAKEIRARLADFQAVWASGSDVRLWEELVYCIFTAGASARMGLRSVEAIRHLLDDGDHAALNKALQGVHRYPSSRPAYIVVTRDYLRREYGMRLRERLMNLDDDYERRDWLARDPRIKGVGYKEASHFLRNIGFKGYAILDKHVVRSLAELGVVDSAQPPTTRGRYLALEERLRKFAREVKIDVDELDLVLWSMKTGGILK